ncbi:sensor domain-containing protein [Streptomyces sp. NPDC008313]|uniref:sensor domain-containing protein n=1 Tax=Streptomyces sp. NPDC008313 TaxID=3364826 RepID=UPI0036EED2CF
MTTVHEQTCALPQTSTPAPGPAAAPPPAPAPASTPRARAVRAVPASVASHARRLLREPFTARTWRAVAYALIALPVSVLCVPLGLLGAPVGRWQRALVGRFLAVERAPGDVRDGAPARSPGDARHGAHSGSPRRARGVAHAALAAPLDLAVAAVTLYGWSIVPMNLAWPLRAGSDYADAWGGPTFAGAWAFHAVVGGIGFLLLMPWLGRAMAAVQLRLAAALLP